jgi:hypothetical protein
MSRTTAEAQMVVASRARRFPGLYFAIDFTTRQELTDPLVAELARPSKTEPPQQAVAPVPQGPGLVLQPSASFVGNSTPGMLVVQARRSNSHDSDETPASPPLDQPRPTDDDEHVNYSDDAEPPPKPAVFTVVDVSPARFQVSLAGLQRDKDTRYRTFFAESQEINWKDDQPAPQPMDELLGRYQFSAVLERLIAVLEPK